VNIIKEMKTHLFYYLVTNGKNPARLGFALEKFMKNIVRYYPYA
jgi:hypothetical protein